MMIFRDSWQKLQTITKREPVMSMQWLKTRTKRSRI